MHLPFYDAKSAAKVECRHALGQPENVFSVFRLPMRVVNTGSNVQ
ncbi:hypothetical protein GCWU000324_01119 [Kingella oralis ATCC 51147]|uniref:Uncharacterized protein n=1 Tax=Kingella oralis ATCC 51147 TaxID=629741 RepID=C4GG52_9NEIS|nr:hypothetical protein GCWU000324_01119 [Kingella oralis ATCC 51147]